MTRATALHEPLEAASLKSRVGLICIVNGVPIISTVEIPAAFNFDSNFALSAWDQTRYR